MMTDDRSEQARAEKYFRSLIENALDIITILNEDGTIRYVSPSVKRVLGYRPETLIGKNAFDFIHSDDYPDVSDIFKHALENVGIPPSTQFRFRHQDGSWRILESIGKRLFDDTRVVGIVVNSLDITERQKAEAKLNGVLESAPDAVMLVNREGNIALVNVQTEKMFGYSRQELLGKPVEFLLPERFRKVHQKHRKNYFHKPRIRSMNAGLDLTGLRQDGSEFPVEISLSPMEMDEEMLAICIVRNITDQKRAERQTQRLAQTVTNMNDCVIITDMQHTINFVNPAFLKTYGYEKHEILGQNIEILRSRNNLHEMAETTFVEMFQEGGWQGEILNVRKNGEEFPVMLSTSVIRDKKGLPMALVGISRDITEGKRLQHNLQAITRQREEDLRHFAVSLQRTQEDERRRIAHDLHDNLGQLLIGTKLRIEMFEDEIPKNNNKVLKKLKDIKQQINLMIKEMRRMSSNLRPTALDDFGLTGALKLLCREWQTSHNLTVNFQSTGLKRHDKHIEIALYRIVQEALTNITKHAEATTAAVQLSENKNTITLIIKDDGKGFIVQNTSILNEQNGGIGLINMRERTEVIGGQLQIESSPNTGTIIRIEIPL